jgi:mono/diheme cytochrome c family protein
MRSSQLVLTDERTMLAHHAPAAAREFEWRALGRRTYDGDCAACHGDDGEGWDQYPPLAGTAALLLAPGGRDYLVDVHLYGLASPRWGAPMPPMGHLPDVALAAVLNHVLVELADAARAAPEARLYLPADVAARRGAGLSPHAVNARRPFP